MDWNALISALGLVFVAELGDKTQLAVISQVCKCRRPWPVFLGASLALVAVTAIGAVGGGVLARLVPQEWLSLAAAASFVVMGLLVARAAWRAQSIGIAEACDPPDGADDGCLPHQRGWDWAAFSSTFALLFVAELGDKTQLAVLSLSGQTQAPWAVFAGGTLALTAVTALGVIGGEGLARLVPERLLLWLSAAAFVVMGLLMALGLL
jgi:putative Ca2+/H+ antiporter (TMEM165/GDT1 family)